MTVKFSVGLQTGRDSFLKFVLDNHTEVSEVYFFWGDFPNGRGSQLVHTDLYPWEMQQWQTDALEVLRDRGISLNLLLNATCYGADSQSKAFFEKVGTTVDYLVTRYGLESVTTASPLIARFCKENFQMIKTRASVNMEIGTVQGMEYLAGYFDGYYMRRELNRDFAAIEMLHRWCQQAGKTLHILGNSGCLNHCSAHVFHDNLVAHESEIATRDNGYQFKGICREYLQNSANHHRLITDTNFIRPEDVDKYEPWFCAIKLATRVHRCPENVLASYIRRQYSGDLLALLEPAHSIYPYVLENGDPVRIVKIGG